MSAAVAVLCRNSLKRRLFPAPAYASKRLCLRRAAPSPLDDLRVLFPHMDPDLLERALVECGNDIDTAIKRLQQLCSDEIAGEKSGPVEEVPTTSTEQGALTNDGEEEEASAAVPVQNPTAPENKADLFVREMTCATSLDDAKLRASRLLEALEKSIGKAAAEEAKQSLNEENIMLKQQMEELVKSNTVLKRAVAIQHERQKDYDEKNNELQHLKQLVSQYQEQLRTLEVNNYALTMHLKQAQQTTSIPGSFHPHVF